jgi:hypothetical protein
VVEKINILSFFLSFFHLHHVEAGLRSPASSGPEGTAALPTQYIPLNGNLKLWKNSLPKQEKDIGIFGRQN